MNKTLFAAGEKMVVSSIKQTGAREVVEIDSNGQCWFDYITTLDITLKKVE